MSSDYRTELSNIEFEEHQKKEIEFKKKEKERQAGIFDYHLVSKTAAATARNKLIRQGGYEVSKLFEKRWNRWYFTYRIVKRPTVKRDD